MSMGLCFDFGAILEGHLDVVFVVDRDGIDHRQPARISELRQGVSVPEFI